MSRLFKRGRAESGHSFFTPVLRLALLLGVLLHLSGFLLFRVISNPLPDEDDTPAYVSYINTDSLGDAAGLGEQAMLFDSAPLFIPGRWSAASSILPKQLYTQPKTFPDFEPEINIGTELKPERIELFDVVAVDGPEDLLDLRFWSHFEYFGQGDPEMVALEEWNAMAEVRVVSSPDPHARVGKLALSLDVDTPNQRSLSARPVVFYLGISAPGIPIGRPILKQSSGVEEIDSEALEWLLRVETLSSLPSGYLEVRCYL